MNLYKSALSVGSRQTSDSILILFHICVHWLHVKFILLETIFQIIESLNSDVGLHSFPESYENPNLDS